MAKTILYFTDKTGVSSGYQHSFSLILKASGIHEKDVRRVSVYGAGIKNLLRKWRNDKNWSAEPSSKEQVAAFVTQKIALYKPDILVCSCPVISGLVTDYNIYTRHLDTIIGSRYEWEGLPCFIVPPVSIVHRGDKKIKSVFAREDEEEDGDYTYVVKYGEFRLVMDWAKVGREVNGTTRKLPPFKWSIAGNLESLQEAREFLLGCSVIAADIETGRSLITCVGYYGLRPDGTSKGYVIPLFDPTCSENSALSEATEKFAWGVIRDVNASDAIKIFQNGAYDNAYFTRDGVPCKNWLLDTIHMWHSLYPELDKSLDVIASACCDEYKYWKSDNKGVSGEDTSSIDSADMFSYWRYNALDCYYTLWSGMRLWKMLQKRPTQYTWYSSELIRAHWALMMSMRGVKVDKDRWNSHIAALEKEAEARLEALRVSVDDPNFNPASPIQKQTLFYEYLGAPKYNAKGKPVGKTGKPSTGKLALKMVGEHHPFFQLIADQLLEAMEPKSQISKVFGMRTAAGRLRTSYSAVGTTTTRLSSSSSAFHDGGNLQNIRKAFRDFVVADDGYVFVEVDYSQSDAAFVAFESGDPTYIETMTSGLDTHLVHVAEFFKRDYDTLVKQKQAGDEGILHPITGVRNIGKRIVHGANFQMSGGTLYVQMGRKALVATAKALGRQDAEKLTKDELVRIANQLLRAFYRRYERLPIWYRELAEQLRTVGSLTNAFGMTRRFLGNPDDHATQREATGFMGQSDTAGNINRTFDELFFGYIPESFRDGLNPHRKEKPLRLDGNGFWVMLQTHDSLTAQVSVRDGKLKNNISKLLTVMRRPVIINGREVSIPVDAQIGKRWGKSMQDIDLNDLHALDKLVATTK